MQKKDFLKNLIYFIFGIFRIIILLIFICIPLFVCMLRFIVIGGVFKIDIFGISFFIFSNKVNMLNIFLFSGWIKPEVYVLYYYAAYFDYIVWYLDYVADILHKVNSLFLEINVCKVLVSLIFIPYFTGNFYITDLMDGYIICNVIEEHSILFLLTLSFIDFVMNDFYNVLKFLIDYTLLYKTYIWFCENPVYLIKSFLKISAATTLPLACYTGLLPIIYIWKIIWVGFICIFKTSLFTYTFISCFIIIILCLFIYFSINNVEFFLQIVDYKMSDKLLVLLKKKFALNLIFCANYVYLLTFLCSLIANYKNISNNFKLTNLHYTESLYNDMFSNISVFYIVFFFMLFIKIVNNFLLYDKNVSLSVILALAFTLLYLSLMLLVSDLFLVYLCMIGLSLSLYILIFFNKKSVGGLEAVSKYFFLGSASSGVFLFGTSLFYKEIGSFNYYKIYIDLLDLKLLDVHISLNYNLIIGIIFIVLGFTFKLSIVPFHGWTPDVYLGSPTLTTCLLSTVVKFGIYCTFIRLYYTVFLQILNNDKIFKNFILILAISSIIIGAVGACDQVKIKKFLGYTTINQMGFILLGLAIQNIYGFIASYIYLIIYVVLNLILFSILLGARYKNRELVYITDLSIFFRNNKHAGLLFALVIFSLAGFPPTIGFFMKFLIVKALVISGYLKLAVLILYINVISIFYYIRLIKIVFLNSEESINDLLDNSASRNTIDHMEQTLWALKDRPLTVDEKNEVNFYLFKDFASSLQYVDMFKLFKNLEDDNLTLNIYTVTLIYFKYFMFYLLSYIFISSVWFDWFVHNKLILSVLADLWLSLNWMYTSYVSCEIFIKVIDSFLMIF